MVIGNASLDIIDIVYVIKQMNVDIYIYIYMEFAGIDLHHKVHKQGLFKSVPFSRSTPTNKTVAEI